VDGVGEHVLALQQLVQLVHKQDIAPL
jgi:hypothetical protein